jgi:predicted TPR repeat methyltransferase
MIARARGKGLYDRLTVASLLDFLAVEAGAHYHLVLAADVFVYCSDLAPIAAAVARVLAPGGLFAFTVETHGEPGVRLQETLRYAHGAGHLRAAIAGAGLEMLQLVAVSTRTEKALPAPGLLVMARHAAVAAPPAGGRPRS